MMENTAQNHVPTPPPSPPRGNVTSVPDMNPEDAPTESHALAVTDHEEKGAAQEDHAHAEALEVKNLGWNEPPTGIPAPLVGGLPNEELWTLVRRFNKQMYYVKAMAKPPPGDLDLNVADEDEFSPDKLRSNIERLYMTVIVGMVSFGKHIARLRSWREFNRTAGFCAAYFTAWLFDMVVPLILTTLIFLIMYPPSRSYLFPPAPIALVDAKTGGLQKPKAGVLGSHDSITGAPEKHQGEAVEQEARNFVSSFGAIAMTSAIGKHPENEAQEKNSSAEKAIPDPTSMPIRAADAKHSASTGDATGVKHDKTKKPVEAAMWENVRPVMHIIGDIADGWERFANALSPTPPFPQDRGRLRIAAVIAPALFLSLFINAYVFAKASTFAAGFLFFGDPAIKRAMKLLNKEFPNWQKLLELRNTILKGVPTNAQLTITLLRIGEANKAPLPPPPRGDNIPAPIKAAAIDHSSLGLDATPEEITAAVNPDPEHPNISPTQQQKPKSNKFVAFIKGTAKTGVHSVLSTDKIKAQAGSTHAKNRLGVIPPVQYHPTSGPVEFKARYSGKKGYAYITTTATTPSFSFSYGDDLKPAWSIPIADITEVRKLGGLGWKSKLFVGWALDREVVDGIEIVTKEGQKYTITAVPLREELFNRIVAIGAQKWESW